MNDTPLFHYYRDFRAAVQACQSRAELVALWKAHEKARARLKVEQGSADYERLALICAGRNGEIRAKEQP